MEATSVIAAIGDVRTAAAKHLATQEATPEVVAGLRATAKRYAHQLLANEPKLARYFARDALETLLRVVDEVVAARIQAA